MHHGSTPPLRIGHTLLNVEEVDSTNKRLWELLSQGLTDGTVLLADYQQQGKGQAGAAWESETHANLLLSLYLRTHWLPAAQQYRLNIAVALAVYDFARMYLGPGTFLKWPNDLFYKDRKLGGILIENTIQGSFLADSVIGIGININQAHFLGDFRATSFTRITGRYYTLRDLLDQLLACLQLRITQLQEGQWIEQRADYLGRLLGLGELRSFEYKNQLIKATIIDVDPEGHLILDSTLGRLVMNNKEIKFRFDEV